MTTGGAAQRPRDLIITLAAQHKLPTVYYERFLVAAGGFFSYRASLIDQHQRAASYVNRILRARNRVTCRCSGRQNSANAMVRPCSCPAMEPKR